MASASTKPRRGRTIAIVVVAAGAVIAGWLWANSDQPAEEPTANQSAEVSAAEQTVEWTMPAGEFGELTIAPLENWELTPESNPGSWIDRSACENEEPCPIFYLNALEGEFNPDCVNSADCVNDPDCDADPNARLCTMGADDPHPSDLPLPIYVESTSYCRDGHVETLDEEVGIGDKAAMLFVLSDCSDEGWQGSVYWWFMPGAEVNEGLLISAYDPASLLEGAAVATEVFEAGSLG